MKLMTNRQMNGVLDEFYELLISKISVTVVDFNQKNERYRKVQSSDKNEMNKLCRTALTCSRLITRCLSKTLEDRIGPHISLRFL